MSALPTLSSLVLALSVVGCASAVPGFTPSAERSQAVETPGAIASDGRYQLSNDELALDCRKLTGRMQVRILQVRDADAQARGTLLARGAQTIIAPVMMGTSRGIDPSGERARDLAVLRAYNDRLREKGCPTFDLDGELRPKPATETPRPVPKP